MTDMIVTMAISVLIQTIRDSSSKAKWRSASLKLFREIARAFNSDKEFVATAKQEFK